jgi:nickel transport system substrate-binding protein
VAIFEFILYIPAQFYAVHLGHHNIGDNQVYAPFLQHFKRLSAIYGGFHTEIVAKQLMKEAGYEDTNDDGILEKDGTSLAIHFNYSQSLASVDNAVLSIAASLKELGFDVTIDAVDMNTWYGALMAGEYDLTFYNTAGGSFDPATDMSNMAPGAMGDPILCQFSAFFENPEIFAELDSTSDSQRVQEIYGMILNGIADQNLLVPVTGTHDLALWNTDKITGYDFYTDASYVDIASVHVK